MKIYFKSEQIRSLTSIYFHEKCVDRTEIKSAQDRRELNMDVRQLEQTDKDL